MLVGGGFHGDASRLSPGLEMGRELCWLAYSKAGWACPVDRVVRRHDYGGAMTGSVSTPAEEAFCSIERTLAIVGDRWSFLILRQ